VTSNKEAQVTNWSDPHSGPPQPPQFVQPQYQWQQQQGNGFAVAALLLGTTSILFCWLGLFALVQVVLAVIFGAVGISRANRGARHKGMAVAGMILGIVGFLLYVAIGIMSLGVGLVI
jgi:hypothetical protein